jgi:hypothetical protein
MASAKITIMYYVCSVFEGTLSAYSDVDRYVIIRKLLNSVFNI